MNTVNSVAIFTRAAAMLAEADTIQKAKELKDLAITAADWAKRKGMGEEAIRYAKSYALEAERKMGMMLAETARAKGGRPTETGNAVLPVFQEPTLADLGLTKRESSEAQMLAAIPEETFQQVKVGKKSKTQVKREIKRAEVVEKVAALPSEKYRVLYADPPWKYGDARNVDGWESSAAEHHYPTMSISELCSLPIVELVEDNAVLFLWVTSPILFECVPIISAWGFKYKASFVWDKIKHNMGHYNSVRHEFLLVCTRGSCVPDVAKLFDSVQSIERTGRHSEKPEEFREIIDTLYPHGKRLELFARSEHEGWAVYGNQLPE